MKYVNLDTLVWFQEGPGVRNYQYVDKGIKLINVTNLVNGQLKLHLTSRYISEEEAFGKYKHFLCDNGDLVIASSGITYETLSKKIAFVTEKDLPLCMNTSVIRFKPINRDVCIDYIYYFFKSEKYRNQISKLMTGSAQLNYGPSHLHKVKIPYYDIVKQTKIADELKKIDENISICYRNIDNLDNIVKSQFIEMFGSIESMKNSKDKLGDVVIINPKKAELDDNMQVSFIPMEKVGVDCTVDTSYKRSVSEIKKGFIQVQENDVLFAKITPCMENGKSTIARGLINGYGYSTTELFNLRCTEKVVPEFVLTLIHMNEFRALAKANMKGAVGQQRVPKAFLEEFSIIIPDIDLQRKYSSFLEQIDKSKLNKVVSHLM